MSLTSQSLLNALALLLFLNNLLSFCTVSGFTILKNNGFTKRHYFRTKNPLTCESMGNNNFCLSDLSLNVTGVTLKMAFDEAYAVADASELKSERFTCSQSLDMVHKLRRWSDAVLVGRSTVESDDCTLTVRRVPLLPTSTNQPIRVVIDPYLKLIKSGNEYAMFKDGHDVFVYHSMSGTESYSVPENVKLIGVSKQDNILSISDILHDLKTRNVHHLMVEGGPATARQFLMQKVVDRAILVQAPITFKEPIQSGMNNELLYEAGLELIKAEKCGDDMIEYWARYGESWPSIDGVENEMWPY